MLGQCPLCKTPVREGRSAFSCEKGRDCSFVIFKEVARRPLTIDEVKVLLEGKKTALIEGFKSKADRE